MDFSFNNLRRLSAWEHWYQCFQIHQCLSRGFVNSSTWRLQCSWWELNKRIILKKVDDWTTSFVISLGYQILITQKRAQMALTMITTLVSSLLPIPKNLQSVVVGYLLSLMAEAPKHTQQFAAAISGISQSQFSKLLSTHKAFAVLCLKNLATFYAKEAAKNRPFLVNGAPWSIAIIIDATLHPRSSLQPWWKNSQWNSRWTTISFNRCE